MDNQIIDIIDKYIKAGDALTPEMVRDLLHYQELDDAGWEGLLKYLYEREVHLEKTENENAAVPPGQSNRFAAEYLESLRQLPMPDEQDFESMFSGIKAEPDDAAEHLTEAFLPYIAERAAFWHPHMDSLVQDLVGEGCSGALYAIHDAEMLAAAKDAKDFRNSVNWWINGYMFRFMYDAICQSGIADHLAERMNMVMSARSRLGGVLGHAPSAAELAEETGLKLQEVMTILGELRTQEKNAASEIKRLRQPRTADIDAAADRIGFEEELEQLDIEERYILQTLYGVGGRERLTAEEAALQMNMPVEDIRKIETRALAKLKQIKGE